jgi:hypothetical protein
MKDVIKDLLRMWWVIMWWAGNRAMVMVDVGGGCGLEIGLRLDVG